ncbi:hypothetical protein B0H10DRAFT_1979957 [Mycena sp. CBHHK59/15]|nr:hypothetical protein B0H10DRAFT_1979957 [Mycena sp. CBHHK59/15]
MCSARFTQPGTSLFCAKSSYELCTALVHADGCLYQSGFMHRDIDIGNVLLTSQVILHVYNTLFVRHSHAA